MHRKLLRKVNQASMPSKSRQQNEMKKVEPVKKGVYDTAKHIMNVASPVTSALIRPELSINHSLGDCDVIIGQNRSHAVPQPVLAASPQKPALFLHKKLDLD